MVKVMHLIDALQRGGAEAIAVGVAENTPRNKFQCWLCTTRDEGPLAAALDPHVQRLALNRKHRFDLRAILRLIRFIHANDINILHAHGSALAVAVLASLRPPFPRIVWHNHTGGHATSVTATWIYRLLARRAGAVINTSVGLKKWCEQKLRLKPGRMYYIPNFVQVSAPTEPCTRLPGEPGCRIICVANPRPEKDSLVLVRAMRRVVDAEPRAHLILVGNSADREYLARVERTIRDLRLNQNVSLLGSRGDVMSILAGCDIGVLSSKVETCPVSLLEYGLAALATVSTDVGQCAEILHAGRCGILVPAQRAPELASGLLTMLRSPGLRRHLGSALQQRVREHYVPTVALPLICRVYTEVRHS